MAPGVVRNDGTPAAGAVALGTNVLGIDVALGGSLLGTVCNVLGTNTSIANALSAAVSPVAAAQRLPVHRPRDGRLRQPARRSPARPLHHHLDPERSALAHPDHDADEPDMTLPPDVRGQDGFTLIELLVAMTLSLIVLSRR